MPILNTNFILKDSPFRISNKINQLILLHENCSYKTKVCENEEYKIKKKFNQYIFLSK